jgi:hypothetical protein
MKTAEFGVPCRAPEPGRCRICSRTGTDIWADETGTLCVAPACVAAARAELTLDPIEAEVLSRPYSGTRYGFAPGRR